MNYHGLVKRLDLPAGWLPPAELEYDDIRAAAISGASWQQAGPGWTRSVLNDIAYPAALTCYLAGTPRHGRPDHERDHSCRPAQRDRPQPVRHRLRRPGRLLHGGRWRHHPRPAMIPPAPPVTKMRTAASRR